MMADSPRLLRRVLVCCLIICVLLSSPAKNAFGTIQNCNPTINGYTQIGTCVDVHPGKYSKKLGVDFPTFSSVKLSSPTGAILVNSVGDLLFDVDLNPLMLNYTSAQVGYPYPIQVWGTGFSSSDTGCTLSGTPVGAIVNPCTISGGNLTASFDVASVPPGVYTVKGNDTTTGGQSYGDFSTYQFTVLPPSMALNPSSGPIGTTVSVYGSGFWTTDACAGPPSGTFTISPSATLTFNSCSISSGSLTGTVVFSPSTAPGTYTISATGTASGEVATAVFQVTPSITLSPSSGPVGSTVVVSGSGFSTSDTSCSLSGTAVSSSTCSVSGGTLTGSFIVANVGAGFYAVTATGSPMGDSASAIFTVGSPVTPSITLSSSSAPVGTFVTVSGSNFLAVLPGDTSCSLSGTVVSASRCSVSSGSLIASFTVANVPAGSYTVTATGIPAGDFATAMFSAKPLPAPTTPISVPISGVNIYIPPDFSGLTLSNIWTSFTNNYGSNSIQLSRQSSSDQIAPNWWKINILNLIVTNSPSYIMTTPSYSLLCGTLVCNRIFVVNRSQYIRLFRVTSPSTAGRYFFKAFINSQSIGASNFPTITVEGSTNPASISGTLRDLGNLDPTKAGQPINLPEGYGAQVVAMGINYLGQQAFAQAFINSTAMGQYTLFGVAPGTYNITAYATGYLPNNITAYTAGHLPYLKPTIVSVAAAQSLEGVDIYMSESVNVLGTVLSETADGRPLPWGQLFSVNSFGQGSATNRQIVIKILNLDGSVVASLPAPYSFGLSTNQYATSFDFSFAGLLGFDGRIPEDYANYTSGLTSSDYLLQAYVTSYVQLEEVYLHVGNATTQTKSVIPLIRTGTFNVTVHFKNSNSTGATLVDNPIAQPGTLTVSAYDMQGILRAQNTTFVPAGYARATVELQGFSNTRSFGVSSLFQQNYGLLPGTYYFEATFTSSPLYSGYANLGVANLYYQTQDIQATIGLGEGVVELSFPMYKAGGILLSLYSIDDESPPLYKPWTFPGSTIQITVIPESALPTIYQTNSTQPIGASNQMFSITGFKTGSYDVFIQTLGYTPEKILHLNVVLCGNTDASVQMIQNPVIRMTVAFRNEGLLSIINSTQPYAQPINHIDGTPVRMEVFDDRGYFVAANDTYIPNKSATGNAIRSADFTLAGFNVYYGDPRDVWSGFYDTTDGARQYAGGLFLYPWNNAPRQFTIRIWVDGYYQLETLQVTVPPRQDVSLVMFMDRASRIHGTVTGPDLYGIARPLSWATVTLQPKDYKLSGIIDVEPGNYTTSSLDGSFQVWVPPGMYGLGSLLNGYVTYSSIVAVSSGSDTNVWIWMDTRS